MQSPNPGWPPSCWGSAAGLGGCRSLGALWLLGGGGGGRVRRGPVSSEGLLDLSASVPHLSSGMASPAWQGGFKS